MKVSRLLGITVLLLKREKMTARELAAYFEVSVRTILRDIEALSLAGIPILATQGSGGGIGFMDGFTLDRQYLSFGELSSVVTALQGIAGLYDVPGYRDAVEKLEALVPSSRREALSEFQDMLDLDFRPWGWGKRRAELPGLLFRALETRRTVRFEYLNSAGECLDRTVEPLKLAYRGSAWYLVAFCRLRGDFRVFRLSRMRNFRLGQERFVRKAVPEGFMNGPPENAEPPVRLKLRFQKRLRFLVEESFDEEAIAQDADGALLVTAEYPDEDWLCGFLLSFGDEVEVLEPEEMREKIAKKAEKIVSRYRT